MNNKLKFYLAVALILSIAIFFSAESKASDFSLIMHAGSSHVGVTEYYAYETAELTEYNENNPGLGIGYDLSRSFQVRAGFYKNSHSKTSTYAALNMKYNFNRYLAAGVQVGAVTGYKNSVYGQAYNETVAPMVLPTLTATFNRASIELGYVPEVLGAQAAVFTFGGTVRF